MTDLCVMLSSWLFHIMFVSGGRESTRLMVSLLSKVSRGSGVGDTLVILPNLHVSAAVVLGPDAEDVFAASDTDDGTTDLLSSFGKLIANHSH